MGWLQTIGFLSIGLLVEVFTVGLFFSMRGGRSFRLGIGFLVCSGFGLLVVGAFRTDPVGVTRTLEGTIHLVAATIIFGLFPVAFLLIAPSLRNDPFWKGLFIYTIITSVVALVLMIVRIWLSPQLSWFGLYERVLVANIVIWLDIMAIRLLCLSLGRGQKT